MQQNPFLKKMGFHPNDRVVLLHADDLGMTQTGMTAFKQLFDFGLVRSGSVMVPCGWFPQVVELCRELPGVDIGVHVTLNSEWEQCRWRPLSSSEPDSGLLDGEGYFHRSPEQVKQGAHGTAVAVEIEAQLEKALGAGLPITHIDSHMGTVFHPKFYASYIRSALKRDLLLYTPRQAPAFLNLPPEIRARAGAFLKQFSDVFEMDARLPVFDSMAMFPLDQASSRVECVKRTLQQLEPGLHFASLHPSLDSPDLRAITPGEWSSRVADAQAFQSEELAEFFKTSPIQCVDFKMLAEHASPGTDLLEELPVPSHSH